VTADVLDLLPQAAPGGWQALHEPHAPGAVLDGQPWASSWSAFLRAVNNPRDPGPREFIAKAAKIQNAAMGERVPAEGGFLVPETLRAQVLAYMTTALVRPRATVLPMASLRLPIPFLDNASQASSNQALGGMTFAFTEEGAALGTSNPNFGRLVLEARKLAAYLQSVPDELVDDGAGAFGDFMARVIAMGLAWTEDDFFIGTNGTGAGCPQAIVNAPCAVEQTRANSGQAPVFTDIVKVFKALHPASKAAGLSPGVTAVAWLLSASAMDAILEMYYNPTGSEVVAPSGWFSMGDGQDIGPSLLGLPCLVNDHQPASGSVGDVMLADLRHFLIGDRLTLTVERSQESGGFIYGASNFRVRSRVDGRYWIQSSTTTESGQSVSPVVVLN
jgi:HK97 family phage major capsid protein